METETREVTGNDVEQKPDEQDAPKPEPTPVKPDDGPGVREPEPETPAEPEQQPEQDADALIKALEPKPKPKPKPRKKAKAKAKPKQAEPKPDKDADAKKQAEADKKAAAKARDEQKQLRERYTALNEKQKKDGHSAGEARAMRNVCEKLGRAVPKWAIPIGQQTGEKKPARIINDEDLKLAHRMNALVFGGTLDKDGRYVAPDKPTKFGAPYVTTHVEKIREAMKGKDILNVLKISQAKLKEFATTSPQEGKKVELEEDTRKAIREFMKANFQPLDKIWARKFAGGAVVLLEDRAKAKRRTKAAAKKRSTPTATSA